MVYVYILKSKVDLRLYVGMSENHEKRLIEHNKGMTRSTKPYRPWEVVYVEEWPDRKTAREREKYLKSGIGKSLSRKNLNLQRQINF